MPEEIKSLIEKIQKEGIQAAEEKARGIEEEARKKAESILRQAKLEAEKIIAQARQEAQKTQETTTALLKQASRDMLISLRQEINALLKKLITAEVQQALKPEELSRIILSFIKEYAAKAKEDVIVSLSKKDAQALSGLLAGLKDTLKEKIMIRPSEDIQAGFVISFDRGKSEFDFTDQALSEYISQYLKPALAEILQGTVKD
jgi:V/A-type H+-transporting ATPase subunit E